MVRRTLGCVALVLLMAWSAVAANAEPRIAFVVGNGGYTRAPLPLPLNDAGLVAEALRTVGFDIVEGADLTQADFVRSFRAFLAKLTAAGPEATAFVYFSGYGFAYDGDNYLVGVDARLDGAVDIPVDATRLSEVLRDLDASPARAKIVAIDAARRVPFGIARLDLASGLAAIEAPPGMLIAYSAEPGTLVQDGRGPYSPYAVALAEMIRVPGLNVVDAFPRIRVRTHQLTAGRQLPWDSSALGAPLVLVPPDPAAPLTETPPQLRRLRPLSELDAGEAYGLAIEIDDLPTYVEYLETFPAAPYALRIWAAVRARREALAWMRAVDINSAAAYWTYLRRYPNGIYAADAGRRLHHLSAPATPPASFRAVDFVGVPPPLPQEPPAIIPYFRSPPPPPAQLIAPPPALFANLAPPRRVGARLLPMPAPLPALAGVPPGSRVSVPAASPPAAANRAPFGTFGPTGPKVLPHAMTRSGAAPPDGPHRTVPRQRGEAPVPGLTSSLPSQRRRVFLPSPRQGNPPPGTYGIPPTRAATLTPSRRQGRGALAPATIGRPKAPQVSGPRPPAPVGVSRPKPPTVAGVRRPPAPPGANRPPPVTRAAPPATCTLENGQQVCR